MPKTLEQKEQEIIDGKVMALLSYLSVFCIIPLIFQRKNPFVLQHGKQGLVIFVAEVGIFVLHILLGTWILRFGTFCLGMFSFIGMLAVLKGRYIALPIASELAEKITL